MQKRCLFIDDNPTDVESVLENLIAIGDNKGLKIECDLLGLNDKFYDDKFALDIAKIENTLLDEYMNVRTYDLVACDFDIEDENINGLDIVKIVRQRNRNCDVVLYSGNLDKIATYLSRIPKQTERFKKIKTIVDCKINLFIDRSTCENELIGILREKTRFETIIENKLREHGDLFFRHGYKQFEGKTLREIANEIERDSYHGIKFKQEIIERGISHMIALNEI